MDRFLYDTADAALRNSTLGVNATVWGPDFAGWRSGETADENLVRVFGCGFFDTVFAAGFAHGLGAAPTLLCAPRTLFIFEIGDCFFNPNYRCNDVPAAANVVSVRYGHTLLTQFQPLPPALDLLPPKLYVHNPDCANADTFRPTQEYTQRPGGVLLVGAVSEGHYPLRHSARLAHSQSLLHNTSIFQHPGYSYTAKANDSTPLGDRHYVLNGPITAPHRAQQLYYASALSNASICLFDSSVVRKAIRKFYEAALSGCVIAADIPLDTWSEFEAVIIPIPLEAKPREVADIINAALDDPARLQRLSDGALALARSKFTCDHKVERIVHAGELYHDGRRGFYWPFSVALDCHYYINSWHLPFCLRGRTWNGSRPTGILPLEKLPNTAADAVERPLMSHFRQDCTTTTELATRLASCLAPVSGTVILMAAQALTVAYVLVNVAAWERVGVYNRSSILVLCEDDGCTTLLDEQRVFNHRFQSTTGLSHFNATRDLLTAGWHVLSVGPCVFLTGHEDPLRRLRVPRDPSWDLQVQQDSLQCRTDRLSADGRCLYDASAGIAYYKTGATTLAFVDALFAQMANGTLNQHTAFNLALVDASANGFRVVFMDPALFPETMWQLSSLYSGPDARSVYAGAAMVHLTCVQNSHVAFYAKQLGLWQDAALSRSLLWHPPPAMNASDLRVHVAALLVLARAEGRALMVFDSIAVDGSKPLPFESLVNLQALAAANVSVASEAWTDGAVFGPYSLGSRQPWQRVLELPADSSGWLADVQATHPALMAEFLAAPILCRNPHAFLAADYWANCLAQCDEGQ